MFAGIDEDRGPQLFRCDPAGHYFGYFACACGTKEQEANNLLEKKVKEQKESGTEGFTFDEAVETAVLTLQTVVGSDLKPADVEISVCTTEKPRFTQLTEADIDAILTRLSDRD